MRYIRAVLLFGALLLAGCQVLSSLRAPPELCLPPGVSAEFFSWPVTGAASRFFRVEEGGMEPVQIVRYRRGQFEVAVVWGPNGLLYVDTRPSDPEWPVWIDRSLMLETGVLRRAPEGSCRWVRQGASPEEEHVERPDAQGEERQI